MNQRGANASYMVKYLKYALECEKYVYIWTEAAAEAERATSDAKKHTEWLKGRQADTARQLESTKKELALLGAPKSEPDASTKNPNNDPKVLKKNCRRAITIAGMAAIISFVLGWMAASMFAAEIALPAIATFMLTLGIGIGIFFFTMIGPGCIVWYMVSKKKYKDATSKKSQAFSGDGSARRQSIILSGKIDGYEARLRDFPADIEACYARERSCMAREQYIKKALATAKKNLQVLYAEDVLPAKYRRISSIATLYEYLALPKYTSVFWNGGSIYSEYDKERIQIEQLENLRQINYTLDDIADNQRSAYLELQNANKTLSNIHSSLRELETSNREIANNTAISALANQQTAAAAQWLAYHTHLNS